MTTKLSDADKKLIMQFGQHFNNTGGNQIVELIEREGVNMFNNAVVSLLQACCIAQLTLLHTLGKAGWLRDKPEWKSK